MRFIKATLISGFLVAFVGCTPAQEKPNGWHRTDGKQIDSSAVSEAIKKCDYIRASRTVTIDGDGPALMGLMKARECMRTEGYELNK